MKRNVNGKGGEIVTSTSEWKPRLSVDLTPEQHDALQRLIPWGLRKKVFHVLVDMLIKAMEQDGLKVLNTVLARELDLPGLMAKRED